MLVGEEQNIEYLLIIHFLLRNPELVQNTHNCRYKHVNLSLLIYFTTLILSQSLAYSCWSQTSKILKLISFKRCRLKLTASKCLMWNKQVLITSVSSSDHSYCQAQGPTQGPTQGRVMVKVKVRT